MFRARHGLLTVETMAALSREVYARMAKIQAFGPGRGQHLVEDTVDQFDRLRAMAHGQKDYLQGTIEFYQARTNTKMTIAAERLAVIAGGHPADHRPVLDPRGQLHRQRRNPLRAAGDLAARSCS